MSRIELLRRTPFRLALLCALLFSVACALGAVVTVALVAAQLSTRLDALVNERWRSVASEYRDGDAETFAALVDAHVRAADPRRSVYLLLGEDGRTLAGNAVIGFGRLGLFTVEGLVAYRVRGARIGPLSLWVGIGEEDSNDVVALVLRSLVRAILGAILLTVGVGLLLARRSARRLAALDGALRAIADGRLDTRLPLSARADDIDAIAAAFNRTVEELERSLRALEQAGTDIAHDLKTPIARLGASLEMAQASAERGESPERELAAAREDADALGRIVDALLRIARLERGERRAAFAPVDIPALLDILAEDYAPLAEEAGIALRRTDAPLESPGPPGPPGPSGSSGSSGAGVVEGDAASLNQLFANLLENALKHGSSGAAVELRVLRDSGAHLLHVEIADEGPGIPPAERENVFRRLYRLERSRSTPGNGLGLSLAAAIVRLHGGTIALGDNAPGLVVRVSLPCG